MKRPRNWGNCEASKAAIEVWVFGGEQPPKRIDCIGGESISLFHNYTLANVSCRIKFLFSLSRAEILRSGCYYTVVGLWFLGILRPLLIPRDVRMCLYGCYAV